MVLEGKAVRKWTLITVLCGAHSFFWGIMAEGSIVAMILGLVTIILGFSFIESHPAYKARRSSNAIFARAMDLGVRIRIYFTLYLAAWFALMSVGNLWRLEKALFFISGLPYMAELWIGMGASWLCNVLFGFSLEPGRARRTLDQYTPMRVEENFIATYVTTIFTAALHTILLAMLCSVIYIALRWHKKHYA